MADHHLFLERWRRRGTRRVLSIRGIISSHSKTPAVANTITDDVDRSKYTQYTTHQHANKNAEEARPWAEFGRRDASGDGRCRHRRCKAGGIRKQYPLGGTRRPVPRNQDPSSRSSLVRQPTCKSSAIRWRPFVQTRRSVRCSQLAAGCTENALILACPGCCQSLRRSPIRASAGTKTANWQGPPWAPPGSEIHPWRLGMGMDAPSKPPPDLAATGLQRLVGPLWQGALTRQNPLKQPGQRHQTRCNTGKLGGVHAQLGVHCCAAQAWARRRYDVAAISSLHVSKLGLEASSWPFSMWLTWFLHRNGCLETYYVPRTPSDDNSPKSANKPPTIEANPKRAARGD